MFTGIIEATGVVQEITAHGTNRTYWISSPISSELKVDQSVSHNGVCLTVEEVRSDSHRVTAVKETLEKSNVATWVANEVVNLERCLPFNGRIDGHFVQGHVDTTAICEEVINMGGSWQYTFSYPSRFSALIIEKGSISLNGISLTVFQVTNQTFSVAIIPYTYEHTNLSSVKKGSFVNLEFDMIGKYISRSLSLQSAESNPYLSR